MAPALLLALALFAPEAAPGGSGAGFAAAPADDYGYVGWCYGAVSGYVDLYDKTMPEVERIERAFPTPSTEENIKVIYPGQRANAREQLKLFRAALTAAEKASPKPIQTEGAAAIAKGRAVWSASSLVTPAKLAQFWMGWTLPAECETRAKSLETKASVLGQALKFNTEETPAPEAAPVETTTAEPAIAPAADVSPMATEPELIKASTAAPADPLEALIADDQAGAYLTAGEVEELSAGGDEADTSAAPDVDVGP